MKHALLLAVIVGSCAAHGAIAADAAAAKPTPPKAHPAAEQGPDVAYEDLAKYMGKRIVVYTKFNTTRTGTLTRHTASEIDLKLDAGADLTVTRDSIKRMVAPVAPPDPLFKAGDAKGGEVKASDVKPSDPKATDPKATAPKPGDSKPAAGKPADVKTGEDSAKKK